MIDATAVLRAYARWRLGRLFRLRPAETQARQMRALVGAAARTRFGRDHGFGEIRSVEDFQAQVPLRNYEDFWGEYWRESFPELAGITWPRRIPYFAVTSGTSTGRTKYIPVSRRMVRSNRDAALDVLVHHLANRPRSRIFGGKNFMLSGSVELTREARGIFSGDLTGIASRETPAWIRPWRFPPEALTRESDWERKIGRIAAAARGQDIRNIAGTANWLLMFFDKLVELFPGPRRLARFFPNLELVVHGGVAFEPYRQRFERWLAGSHAELREVYPASEGFIAVADRGTGDGLRLNLDGGIFYEFVPVEELSHPNPTRCWIGDVREGRDYALVLSNCAGLWGYVLGDTVRFVDLDPPRLVVTGRISYFLSAFGEHLTGEEIANAVRQAATEEGVEVNEYSVGAVFRSNGRLRGGHLFIVEPVGGDERSLVPERFAERIDRALQDANDDYRTHRAGSYGMDPPEVLLVQPGTFAHWMDERGKLGGQNKVPRVINDQSLFASLRETAVGHRLPSD